MANTRSYPSAAPKSDDLLLGTSMPAANSNDDPKTVNFSIGQINGLANSPNIVTKTILITDAQLRTIGTAPVEILPMVSGYTYQILGVTAQPINAGGLGDEYDWQGQNGFISWRNTLLTNAHRVEVPNDQLPSGGGGISDSLYVGTPIAGSSRVSSSLIIGVTNNTNPIVNIGENPSATWRINITYRLIQAG